VVAEEEEFQIPDLPPDPFPARVRHLVRLGRQGVPDE
jgi:hypothetical protein